jgi:hypothetical protein
VPGDRGSELPERLQQNIGEDQRIARAAYSAVIEARSAHDLDIPGDAVDARIVARRRHRTRIDVPGKHGPVQPLGCGNGKDPAAGADIQHARGLWPMGNCVAHRTSLAALLLHDAIQREQASARAAVMPGTEGEGCLDLDGDPVHSDAGTVVRPVNHKAAGCNGRESFEALPHPISGRQSFDHETTGERARAFLAYRFCCDRGEQIAGRRLICLIVKMQQDCPRLVCASRNGDRNRLAVTTFSEGILKPRGSGGIGSKPRNRGA